MLRLLLRTAALREFMAALYLIAHATSAFPQAPVTAPASPAAARPARPAPPTRDPNTPGYVSARELPDGAVPPTDADGNFILGPTHNPALDMTVHPEVPKGTIFEFTMSSADSRQYPGIARDPGTFGTPDPADPAKLIVTTSHPASYTRHVAVYVPAQYVPGTVAPFIVGADGPDRALFTALDNLIAEHKLPVQVAISIGNGSGDAQGSERGLEYDTMSGRYAEFVENEVLPLVEAQAHVKLTHDPDAPGHHGRQFRRLLRADHGLVPPRSGTIAFSPTRELMLTSSGLITRSPRTAPGSFTST